jgi:ribosomal protein L24
MMVKRTHLPATIKLTQEKGYDVRPGDHVCIAHGPEFRTTGLVCSMDYLKAELTMETITGQRVSQTMNEQKPSNFLQCTLPI